MGRIITTDSFIQKLNSKFSGKSYKVIGEYSGYKNKILTKDKYGVCFSKAAHLIYGTTPSIKTAVNKTSYSINQALEIHGDTYDYSDYIYKDADSKCIIKCKIHGDFEQIASTHYKSGCPKCGRSGIKNGWTYSNWQKAGEKSKNFDSFKCYIIRCWNDNEEFYKIGKTYRALQKRFSCKRDMPYNYEIIKVFKGESREISKLEKKLQKENKEFKYKPFIEFRGMYESYSDIKTLLKYIEDNNI